MQSDQQLVEVAQVVGNDWKEGQYYADAELAIARQWDTIIWPIIRDCDFTCVVEIGAGHGRNSEKLRELADTLILVDINIENIEYLRKRFADAENIRYIHNDGLSLGEIADAEASLVYSFDSMVHFDSDVVRAYLREFNRILRPGGYGFCHYSNYTANPTGSYRINPAWRNFMSRELFEHYATKEGLSVVGSWLQDWARDSSQLDCITLFRRPLEWDAVAADATPKRQTSHAENCGSQGRQVAELQRYVGELEEARDWYADQHDKWQRYAGELKEARDWYAQQRDSWQGVALERGKAVELEQARIARFERWLGWALPSARVLRKLFISR